MYVHIGEDTVVRLQDIIAILDKKTVRESEAIADYLEMNKKYIVPLTSQGFKSVIITVDAIYFSSLASGTIKKRSNKLTVPEFL